jgi:hypothetical protein
MAWQVQDWRQKRVGGEATKNVHAADSWNYARNGTFYEDGPNRWFAQKLLRIGRYPIRFYFI